nr:MAG TPA: Protein of unknown function (DUF3545) [Caudoviricetes sp.]
MGLKTPFWGIYWWVLLIILGYEFKRKWREL